jgi:hypothetical protein
MKHISITIYDNYIEIINVKSDKFIEKISFLQFFEKYYKRSHVKITNTITNTILTNIQSKIIELIKNPNNTTEKDFVKGYLLLPYYTYGINQFRKDQLNRFLKHMNSFLDDNYKIVVIEQKNNLPFNRGKLLNIGFLECEKIIDCKIKYYIHHNIDLFPENTLKNHYTYTPQNIVKDLYGHKDGIGGITIINKHTFKMINGYPNNFVNWGGEDIVLLNRLKKSSIIIDRSHYNKGIFEEQHPRINNKFITSDSGTGLDDIKYQCTIDVDENFIHINTF